MVDEREAGVAAGAGGLVEASSTVADSYLGTINDASSSGVRRVGSEAGPADTRSYAVNTVQIVADGLADSAVQIELIVGETVGTGGCRCAFEAVGNTAACINAGETGGADCIASFASIAPLSA